MESGGKKGREGRKEGKRYGRLTFACFPMLIYTYINIRCLYIYIYRVRLLPSIALVDDVASSSGSSGSIRKQKEEKTKTGAKQEEGGQGGEEGGRMERQKLNPQRSNVRRQVGLEGGRRGRREGRRKGGRRKGRMEPETP